MKKEKQDEIGIPAALALFLGVGCVAWFFFLPGKIGAKWNGLNKYMELHGDEVFIAFLVVGVNGLLLFFSIASIFGIGRLGKLIGVFYLKQKRARSRVTLVIPWMLGTLAAFNLIGYLGLLEVFTPFPSFIPVSQSTLFLNIINFSASSLIGLLVTVPFVVFQGLSQKTLFQKMPKISKEKNTLVIGARNEF